MNDATEIRRGDQVSYQGETWTVKEIYHGAPLQGEVQLVRHVPSSGWHHISASLQDVQPLVRTVRQ